MSLTSEVFFKIKLLFFGYFNPVNFFLIIKICNFRGYLSDISAKTATLSLTSATKGMMPASAMARRSYQYVAYLKKNTPRTCFPDMLPSKQGTHIPYGRSLRTYRNKETGKQTVRSASGLRN